MEKTRDERRAIVIYRASGNVEQIAMPIAGCQEFLAKFAIRVKKMNFPIGMFFHQEGGKGEPCAGSTDDSDSHSKAILPR